MLRKHLLLQLGPRPKLAVENVGGQPLLNGLGRRQLRPFASRQAAISIGLGINHFTRDNAQPRAGVAGPLPYSAALNALFAATSGP